MQKHHALISLILSYAEKEMLIPYNTAAKVINAPKKEYSHKANYFQLSELEQIRDNLLYAKDYGIYQDTPKTETSTRTVPIPQETAELLREYRQWWLMLRKDSGSAWNMFIEISDSSGNVQKERADFLFIQEGGKLGYPMHPDSITQYLSSFSKREKLPHINPHAFRHTLASVLCLNGIDITTISKWLGHNNVTTTLNIYEHILEEGKEKVADCISDVILKKRA